jgi:adenylate cyclase
MLKSKKLLWLIGILSTSLLMIVFIFWSLWGSVWTQLDFQALDLFYKESIKQGYGPKMSSQVVYLNITEDTYGYFGKNTLDRGILAKVNDALAELGVEAVAYDLIFSRPSDPISDELFAQSIKNPERVYLPIGLEDSEQPHPFKWREEGAAYERFQLDYIKKPIEIGISRPVYATRALMQLDKFLDAAFNTGHVTASSDPDGIYRHALMLIKVDSSYFPALALSMFLDYAKVSLDKIEVNWGREIRIPAIKGGPIDYDVVIPIDYQGRTFIPFPQVWGRDFEHMAIHKLLEYWKDEGLQGNLTEFFEGKFVFIGDVSSGISDLGQTPLEEGVPLIALHAALMNGFLTNTFYREWAFWPVMGFISLIGIILSLSAFPKPLWVLYTVGIGILIALVGGTWFQLVHFSLFPIVTVGGSFLFIFFGLVIGLQLAIYKDQAFIRNAFSKYVPEKVVNELLTHPELLKLGGEERVLSVLFSDLEGFTTLSEKMSPTHLVSFLNDYFTEMTNIIITEGGIIDKYSGDGIMAEFGAPLPIPNHADIAVKTGLKMQRRLRELRDIWREKGLPEVKCRIGINTGPMIIGNMGSHQVFDYTVIGDAVNLASRLESINKRYNTHLMISESTYKGLTPGVFRTRVLDVVRVKGKMEPVKIHEVYGGVSDPIEPSDLEYYQTYEAGFMAFLAKDFTTAREKFVSALTIRPKDLASKEMLVRIANLNPEALPKDWDLVTLNLK